MEPASIRYKNPGAMWGNALARKWGATSSVVLNDGLGQGNNIAVFPTYVQGICAQLDLWRTSPNYKNKRFCDAIAIWSGHNNVESYINYVLQRVPGMERTTIMDDNFWRGPMGIAFLKAQAGHEAGKTYPAAESDWLDAQRLVFAGIVPKKPKPAKAATSAVIVGTAATAVAHQLGVDHMSIFSFILGFGLGGALIWFGKTKIQSLVIDANALSAKLHAQADAIAKKV